MGLPKITTPEYSLELPSTGKEYKYRPFLVREEKILLIAMESEDEKQIISATKQVISNCIIGDELDIDNLPTFDIEYIFLWLRAKSKGEIIELKYKCPTCKGDIGVSFNAEEVKIKKDEKHDKNIKLTDSLGIVMKYPNIDNSNFKQSENDTEIDMLIEAILSTIDYIYDNDNTYSSKDHTKKEMQEFLESLNDSQFRIIGKFFETMPKLSHNITLECKNKTKEEGKKKDKVCGYKEDLVLEGLSSFFE